MKRFNNLFDKIVSFENLWSAAYNASKGKRKQHNVSKFNMFLEHNLLLLQKDLLKKTYKPGNYTEFYIYEPKKRMISAAPFRDRVVHHALCNIIEPIFDKTFIYDTYANRVGKGTHAAINRYKEFAKKNKYVIKFDLRKYFPSIVHSILKKEIRKKIKCINTLWLIDLIIDNSNEQEFVNHRFESDNLFSNLENKKGLPMGNLTSQFFSNIYLNTFDHFVKEKLKCKYYIRYVDDFVILENSAEKSNELIKNIKQELIKYRLKLHDNKTKIFLTEKGISFLGQRIFPLYSLINKSNLIRFYNRIKKKYDLFLRKKISKQDFLNSYISWIAHAKNAHTFNIRSKINAKFVHLFWDELYFKDVVFFTDRNKFVQDDSSRRLVEQQRKQLPRG